jgi:hypothetical protein
MSENFKISQNIYYLSSFFTFFFIDLVKILLKFIEFKWRKIYNVNIKPPLQPLNIMLKLLVKQKQVHFNGKTYPEITSLNAFLWRWGIPVFLHITFDIVVPRISFNCAEILVQTKITDKKWIYSFYNKVNKISAIFSYITA